MSFLSTYRPNFSPGHLIPVSDQSFVIDGYAVCDGSIAQQSQYPQLFNSIGLIVDGGSNALAGTAPFNPRAIIYTNGLYVIAGNSRAVSSTDNISTITSGAWTNRLNAGNGNINTLAYGHGLYVFGGDYNGTSNMGTSTDTINWTEFSLGTADIIKVIYNNGLFVATGWDMESSVFSSTNGVNWTTNFQSTRFKKLGGVGDASFDSLARYFVYGNGVYLVYYARESILADNIATSTNLVNWTVTTNGTDVNITDITYGNGLFVQSKGTTSNNILTSTNGTNWTVRTSNTSTEIHGLAHGLNVFVRVGLTGNIGTSTNGISWTARTSPTTLLINSVAYGNGIFVARGTSQVLSSTNAINWSLLKETFADGYSSITYGNGKFVLFNSLNQTLNTTTNAISFDSYNMPATILSEFRATALRIKYAAGYYIINPSVDNIVCTSSDLVNWNTVYYPTLTASQQLAAANEYVIFNGDTSKAGIISITDLNNFGQSQKFLSVSYTNGQYFFPTRRTIATSTDLINYTYTPNITTTSIHDIAYDSIRGLYAVAGTLAASSTDLINWRVNEKVTSSSFFITSYSGIFLRGGLSLSTSTNGMNWTGVAGAHPLPMYAIERVGGAFYYVGNNAAMRTYVPFSYDIATEFKLPTASSPIVTAGSYSNPTTMIKLG